MSAAPFGPDRDAEVPELLHISRGTLLVQSFESFAVSTRDASAPNVDLGRNVEIVTFSGRWNKSEETVTLSILLEEDGLVDLIASLQKGLDTIRAAT